MRPRHAPAHWPPVPPPPPPRRRRWLWRALATAPTLVLLVLGGWVLAFAITKPPLPDVDALVAGPREPIVRVLAADGSVLAQQAGGGQRFVALSEVAPALLQAILATEDQRFWQHWGVDPFGVARAVVANLRAGGIDQGGSTITQQLAKILFLRPERSFRRKAEELMLALWLEARLGKAEILTVYVNRVYLGAGTFGVEAAARRYFAKPAAEVTLPEAALLAGLLKAPSALAPTHNLAAARDRAAVVLGRMVAHGDVNEAAALAARTRPAKLALEIEGDLAGHAVDRAMDAMEAAIGRPREDLVLHTTLDPALQRLARDALRALLAGEGRAAAVGDGALVLVDDAGAVRALVGGADYRRSRIDRSAAARQPGSAFKPFVFLAALEAGFDPNTPILDAPFRLGRWTPANYDGRYRGQVPMREALAESLNTATARLVQAVGVAKVVEVARRAGIASPLRPLPSLALGTSEVTLFELTAAYRPFATAGAPRPMRLLDGIDDARGTRVWRPRERPQRLIPAADAGRMRAMLEGVVTHGTGKAAAIQGRAVFGKTGTTQNNRDAWFVGGGGGWMLGVWLGNDDGRPMQGVTGGTLPARLWREVMVNVLPPIETTAPSITAEVATATPVTPSDVAAPTPAEPSTRASGWLVRLVEEALATARQ